MLKSGFAVVFYRPDEQFVTTEKMSIDQINVQTNVHANVQINSMEQQVLSLISVNPNLSIDEIAVHISKSSKTAQRCLDSLRKKNIIRRIGSTKSGIWEIISIDTPE